MASVTDRAAFCAVCGNVGKVKKDGTMHGHTRQRAAATRTYSDGGGSRERCPGSGQAPRILMKVSMCERCHQVKRLADDATGVPRMCDGCGAFGSLKFIGVTLMDVAKHLEGQFAVSGVVE